MGYGPADPVCSHGASKAVLQSWVDAIEAHATSQQAAAAAATQRNGWPADAVPTAAAIVAFTEVQLMPGLIPSWDTLVEIEDEDLRITAMRKQVSRWRETRAKEDFVLAWFLDRYIDANRALRTAEKLAARPEVEWGSRSPMAQARTAARRCGEMLCHCDETELVPLLDELPSAP
jgi:hypothetical protein